MVFVLLTLAAASLAACGGRSHRFTGNGYEFRYPGNWKPRTNVAFAEAAGAGALSEEAVGMDDVNLAVMVTARVDQPVTTATLAKVESETTGVMQRLAAQGGGRVTAGPLRLTMGGLPALRYDLSGIQVGKTKVDVRVVLAVRGTLEYFLTCQHTPDAADQVESACDQIVRSFEVAGPTPSA